MKVRLEIDDSLKEDEIVIRTKEYRIYKIG